MREMPNRDWRLYRIGDHVVDTARACLLRDGTRVELRPKAYDVLLYLIENRGRVVTKEELIRALWSEVVVTDDSLVKCIQEARSAIGDDGHRMIRTVPRRGYILEAPVAAEPASSVREQGGSRSAQPWRSAESPAESGPNPPDAVAAAPLRARAKPAAAIAAALALVALAAGVGLYTRLAGDQDAARVVPRSVAVLPFDNLGADQHSDYFAAGVHDSILTHLAQIGDLQTIARTSMLRYAGTDKSIAEIARELNVETVMEGSVQYDRDRVRITAQLIDPATDMHLWAAEYDRPLADVFAIQTDIARQIANALDAELSAREAERIAAPPTSSTEAYQLYSRGRYHWDKTDGLEVRESIRYFEQAIHVAPDFARAYAGLADAYTLLHGLGAAAPAELMPRAKAAAERALAIDPELAEAYVSRAMIRYFYEWDYESGNADFERAIALDPNLAIAHHLYGKNLIVEKRFAEALAELERALELDPYSAAINKDIGETLLYANRINDAVAAFERSGQLDPGSLTIYFWLSRCHELLGQHDLAIDNHLALVREGVWADSSAEELERIYREAGWAAYWREWLDDLSASAEERHIEPFRFVEVAMRLGDHDAAIDRLEIAVAERSAWAPAMHIDPLLFPLHGDPRFESLLRRAGLDGYR